MMAQRFQAALAGLLVTWAAAAHGADLGFRFNGVAGECQDAQGSRGLNPGFIGECGDLRGAVLERRDLKGLTFSGADLEGANLKGADLRGAIFRRARLEGADLTFARLEGARLSGASLANVRLRGARLNGAYLYRADLRGADLGLATVNPVEADRFRGLFKDARFDAATDLPFSRDEALERGMKDVGWTEVAGRTAGAEPKPL